jgi:hypothetical protein
MPHTLNVLLTIDTEINQPLTADWRRDDLEREWQRDIEGTTPFGDFGVGHQLRAFTAAGLKATFFVETLFAAAAGRWRLEELVGRITRAGQDVQLHMHLEWLPRMPEPWAPPRDRNFLDFPATEQADLVRRGATLLREAGAPSLKAFRAGNFGANADTLSAVAAAGLLFDSSYARPLLRNPCSLFFPDPPVHPFPAGGVLEFPVSCFEDWPGHWRLLQLCACSITELKWAMNEAWRRRWPYVVIVLHSFELLRRPLTLENRRPDRAVVKRFDQLCQFLDEHRTRFRTVTFAEIDPLVVTAPHDARPLRSHPLRTARRYVEQVTASALRRPWSRSG